MRNKLLKTVVAVAILVAAAVMSYYLMATKPIAEKSEEKRTAIYVKVDTVRLGDYDVAYNCNAKVCAGANVKLSSEVNGRIIPSATMLREGAAFRKGEVIVKLYDEDVKAALISQRSQYMSLLSQSLSDISVDFPGQYKKWSDFFTAISVDAPLPPLPAIGDSKEKVYISVRNIIANYYNVKQQEINLQKYTIYAPFDGVFTSVSKEVGAIANMGGEIAAISRTDLLELEAGVESENIRHIAKGSRVWVEYSPEQTYTGVIDRVAQTVDGNTQRIKIYIKVNAPAGKLIIGELYKIRLAASSVKGVMQLPREAMFTDGVVYRFDDGKIYAARPDVVYTDEDYVYLRGLDEGAIVVCESLVNPYDAMEVQQR